MLTVVCLGMQTKADTSSVSEIARHLQLMNEIKVDIYINFSCPHWHLIRYITACFFYSRNLSNF